MKEKKNHKRIGTPGRQGSTNAFDFILKQERANPPRRQRSLKEKDSEQGWNYLGDDNLSWKHADGTLSSQ